VGLPGVHAREQRHGGDVPGLRRPAARRPGAGRGRVGLRRVHAREPAARAGLRGVRGDAAAGDVMVCIRRC
jgi:hypothetical protein